MYINFLPQCTHIPAKKQFFLQTAGLMLLGANVYAANTNLGDMEFGNEVKNNMAAAIDVVCPQLVGLNADGKLDETGQLLLTRCGEMVQSANEIEGSGGTDISLGLSQEELGAAMGELAAEEVGSQGDWATRTSNEQLSNIQSRFADIHAGSTGISFNGLQLKSNHENISFNELVPTTGGNAGSNTGPWGLFITGVYSTGERDATERQTGFDLDSLGLTAGIDYRFSSAMVAGVAMGYTSAEADFDNNGGGQDVDGYNFTLYGSFYLENLYFDGSVSFGQYDYDSERTIVYDSNTAVSGVDSTAEAATEGDQWNFYLARGYTINLGSINLTPYAQLRYLDVTVDAFEETGGAQKEINMAVAEQSVDSMQSIIGGSLAFNISSSWGVIIPYLRADWHHEFKNESRETSFHYVYDPLKTAYTLNTDDPDEDFFVVATGLSMVYRSGQAFFDIESPVDLDDVSNVIVTLGARFAF